MFVKQARNPAKPIWLPAKYASSSSTCGHFISVGEVITWVPLTKARYCNSCSQIRDREAKQARLRQILLQPDLFQLV